MTSLKSATPPIASLEPVALVYQLQANAANKPTETYQATADSQCKGRPMRSVTIEPNGRVQIQC